MKQTHLLLASLLALSSWHVAVAQDDLVLNVDFTADGITLEKGDATTNVVGKSGSAISYASTLGGYLGSTQLRTDDKDDKAKNSDNGKDFFYIKYDADDAVGKALSSDFTVETVFRLDKIASASYDKTKGYWTHNNSVKIIGSQQSGGFSIIQNVTNRVSVNGSKTNQLYGFRPQFSVNTSLSDINFDAYPYKYLNQGTFYHILFTYSGTTGKATVYLNGVKCFDGNPSNTAGSTEAGNNLKFPECGTTTGSKGMFIILGGDAAGETDPTTAQSPCSATFKYFKIYNTVKTPEQVAALYDDDVKAYTEAKPKEMMLDMRLAKDGSATDASSYKKLDKVGTILTQYNADQGRYEMVCEGNNANFLKRSYQGDPVFAKSIADGYTFEVYAKGPTTDFTTSACLLSGEQYSGGPSLGVAKTNKVRHNGNIFGVQGCPKYYYSKDLGNVGKENSYITDGKYHHYVATFQAGQLQDDNLLGGTNMQPIMALYMDGKILVKKENTWDENSTSYLNGNEHTDLPLPVSQWLAIGGDADNTDGTSTCQFPWTGDISIARVWGRLLTEEEVAKLYTQASTTNPTTKVTISASGYSTLSLPYVAVVPEGVTAYKVTGFSGNSATLATLATAGQAIPFDCPVILQGTAGQTYTFAAGTGSETLGDAEGNLLSGTVLPQTVAEANDVYVLTHNDNNEPILAHNAAGLTLPESKACVYTTIVEANTSTGTASKEYKLGVDPTAIKRVDAQRAEAKAYYDLQGRKVATPTRGIYIQNGKKVFVK